MTNEEAIQYLSDVLFNQLRKKEGCGKLQFTFYGKCESCEWSEDCHKLSCIKELLPRWGRE